MKLNRINLNDPRIMNSKDAAVLWGKDDSSIRFRKDDFPKGTLRKIGRDWVVTEEGMLAVFGRPKTEEELLMNGEKVKAKFTGNRITENVKKIEDLAINKLFTVEYNPKTFTVLVEGVTLSYSEFHENFKLI